VLNQIPAFAGERDLNSARETDVEMQKYSFRRMKNRFGFISYNELAALYETAIPHKDPQKGLLMKFQLGLQKTRIKTRME
jgi:hypothetical protein